MLGTIVNKVKKIVGSKNERELKKLWPVVAQINSFEQKMTELTDDHLCKNH
jgi:preprotein translocase subunit SecA